MHNRYRHVTNSIAEQPKSITFIIHTLKTYLCPPALSSSLFPLVRVTSCKQSTASNHSAAMQQCAVLYCAHQFHNSPSQFSPRRFHYIPVGANRSCRTNNCRSCYSCSACNDNARRSVGSNILLSEVLLQQKFQESHCKSIQGMPMRQTWQYQVKSHHGFVLGRLLQVRLIQKLFRRTRLAKLLLKIFRAEGVAVKLQRERNLHQ